MFSNYSLLPFPICIVDEKLIIQDVNSTWMKTFSLPNSKNQSLLRYISSEEEKDSVQQFVAKTATHPETSTLKFNLIDGNGQIVPLLWGIVYEPLQKLFLFCGQNQSHNQAIETRYERMYHTTSDAIMLLDQNKFTDCNKATLDIFKVNSVEEFVRYHPADLSPPLQPDGMSSLEKANKMITKAITEGRHLFEWTHRNSKGEDFPCEVLLSRIELHGKYYLQATVRDISERVKFQKEIEEAHVQQVNASRLASLGEMAGGIAHEINNPMAVIRSQGELLINSLRRNGQIDNETLEKGLNRIITTSDRISRIIKGLKLISRDPSNDPLLPTDLVAVIIETLSLCEEKLKARQIQFDFIHSDEVLSIKGREAEISQVILNLMSNSMDAVQNTLNPWIKIILTKDDAHAILKVIDSGSGIPFGIADKITLPFYTTKEVGKGTGLGLSITKRIIERHNGEFTLDLAAPNTTFVIRLPLQK